ncbi:MAG: hypothetical protein ACP5JG_07930 [Anaerolineae bacterium]
MSESGTDKAVEPLLLLDIHHSGYLGWGVWRGQEAPERWTVETVERLIDHDHYKMGLNLGAQTYEWSPDFAARVRDWLERFPDRLYVTGGDYAQPTACVRTGESNLRQLLYGVRAIETMLGQSVSIWTVSEPGNFAQLPQILRDLGYGGALMRIHGPGQEGSLTPRMDEGVIWWKGPDGSRIKAVPEYKGDRFHLLAAVPSSMWIMTRYQNARAARGNYTLDDLWAWKEEQAAKGISPVVMSKDDDHNNQYGNNNLCMTSGHLLAADTADSPRFRWVTAEELFRELPEPPVTLAADPNLFETRKPSFCDYGHRENADWVSDLEAEAALRMADFATVLAASSGQACDSDVRMEQAWKSHLMAQNHDLSLKRSLDLAYHLQYEAQRLATRVRDDALSGVLSKIDTDAEFGAVVVFNPLGRDRTDYAEISVPAEIAENGALSDGRRAVPWQRMRRDGERVVMGFVADVPSLGYTTCLIGRSESEGAFDKTPGVAVDPAARQVKTSHYTAILSPDGGFDGLWASEGTAVAGSGTVKLAGEIGGELHRSEGEIERIERGPVFVRVYESGSIGPHHRYQAVYRFADRLPYIDVRFDIWAEFRSDEVRAAAPIGTQGPKLGAEVRIPKSLGVLTCMREQPFLVWPFDLGLDPIFAGLQWVDFSGPAAGVTALNRGEIGYRWDQETRTVSNILATGQLSELHTHLGLFPHDGRWLEGGACQAGAGFGNPFYCAYEPPHSGHLPRRFQLLRISPETVTVSSVFRQQGKSYLRLFDHAGSGGTVVVDALGNGVTVQPTDLRLRPTGGKAEIAPHGIIILELSS